MRRPRHPVLLLLAAAALPAACGGPDPHPETLVRGWRLRAGTVGQGVQPVAVDIGRDGRVAGTYRVARDGRVERGVRRIEDGTWRVRPADEGGGDWLCVRYAAGAPERCAPYELEAGERLAWGPLTLEPVGRAGGGVPEESSEREIETAAAPSDTAEPVAPAEPAADGEQQDTAPEAPDTTPEAPDTAPEAPDTAPAVRTTTQPSATPRPPGAPARSSAPDHADSLARCDAPGDANQRACLLALVAENDVDLQRVYRELTAELARRPAELRALRAEQREWIRRRDRACRERTLGTEGRLWGTVRAVCFGEVSGRRTEELERRLELARERAAQGLR